MHNKNTFPYVVLEFLIELKKLQFPEFKILNEPDVLYKAVSIDEHSDFHFTIKKHTQVIKGQPFFDLHYKPTTVSNLDERQFETGSEQILKAYLINWKQLIQKYQTADPFAGVEDPILKAFTEEFYSEFEIVDADADTAPFNTKQILYLDAYLDHLKQGLTNFSGIYPNPEVKNIIEEIEITQENLTSTTKRSVVKSISKIWGKIAKAGPKYLKEFLTETKKEFFKQVAKGAIDKLPSTGEAIAYIENFFNG